MTLTRENAKGSVNELRKPVLTGAEADHRMGLLADLKGALETQGVRSVPARRQRLVPQYNLSGPCPRSGLTDPQLHALTAGKQGADQSR